MEDNQTLNYPGYVKFTIILICIILLAGIITYAHTLIIPIAFALLFAILLRPVVSLLNEKLKFPHVIAVLVTVVLFSLLVTALFFFVFWQVSGVMDDWNKLRHNFLVHYEHLRHWIRDHFNISYNVQEEYLKKVKNESIKGNSGLIGKSLISFTGVLASAVLVPIYIFLILLYRNLFIRFICLQLKEKGRETFGKILSEIKDVIQSYIVGLLIEMSIVITLTTAGLMIVGVEYALLLGTITAILNLVPYVGLLIAGIITFMTALLTSTEASVVLGSILVNVLVQLIDNNFLVPRIVGNKVRINAFVSMTAVIAGGIIGGVAGMFLSIPMTAILKVVFDNVEHLKPWGYVMGDDSPQTYNWGRLRFPSFNAGSMEEKVMTKEDKEGDKQEEINDKP
ncbi:MAG TPA: AI-2E family transporter [Flavobacteriales bacterium]|nr:AI-2E family transporter [Flavobacteriales bacterium]